MAINFTHLNISPKISCCSKDAEEEAIAAKLLAYGETPTGDKSTDRAKLRTIEQAKAKQECEVSNKFLTISTQEQDSIQEKKKVRQKDNSNSLSPQNTGAKIIAKYNAFSIKKNKNLEE